jgi:hypothetical protein
LQREVKFRIVNDVLPLATDSNRFCRLVLVSVFSRSEPVDDFKINLMPPASSKRVRIERQSFQELMYFGGGFIAGRICNALARQGDFIVVARWLGAASLGIYQRAYQFMAMPANIFGLALDKVLFPVMAKLQTIRLN